jgi:molybdopterin molybdotransferase
VAALLPLEDAIRLVLEHARPLASEPLLIGAAAGRVLAEAATAQVDLPPFRSSAMDGFAVRAGDLPGSLPLVGESAAGLPATEPLGPDTAMRIATGGVVPEGADAVVPREQAEAGEAVVAFVTGIDPGANIREPGRDIRAGETVLGVGAELGYAQVAALAAAGCSQVRCAVRPRVAILVTGSELRPPGEPLEPGQLYESNGLLLAAALEAAGATVERLAVVSDVREELRGALARALGGFDVLVTTGGVSVGEHDLVRETQQELGVEEVFWRVAMKPGKPVAFGTRGGCLVFNLPGNPVSVLAGFEMFVRPALRALLGVPDPGPRYRRGVLAAPIRRNAHRFELVRALAREGGIEPVLGQESHMIVRAAQANALVAVEPGEGELAAGATVRFIPL